MKHRNTTALITTFAIILFVGVFGMFPAFTYAQTLDVTFEADPLFDEANFLPGNEVVRTVDVTNFTEGSQNVIVEAVNATDDDGLGDVLSLVIKEGATTIYENTLGDFLRAGEIPLSLLGANGSTVYSFGVTFDSDANNDTQETVLGFDLCVGFEGGETHCGGTVIGGEGDTEGGGPTGGGGGGGGIINITQLEVFNEEVIDPNNESVTALIEWESNLLSTSQVIYGKESEGPYSLNLTVDPYFGYPLGTVEDGAKVTEHSVLLTGLESGVSYVYRVVSRASPPTVGFQYKFALNEEGNLDGPTVPSSPTNGGTSSGGANTSGGTTVSGGGSNTKSISEEPINDSPEAEEESGVSDEDYVFSETQAAALGFLTFPDSFSDLLKCLGLFLLFMLLIYTAWIISTRKDNHTEPRVLKRRNRFFFVGSLISIFIAYVLGWTCTITPLAIFAVIFLALYIYNLFTNKEK